MARSDVLDWLLEEEQPSIRYRTLTELLGRGPRDADVRAARAQILRSGWAAEILTERDETGGWNDAKSQYVPKYTSTNWRMLVLSDLGVTRASPVIRDACERWMAGFAATGGRLGGNASGTPHYCVAANQARGLLRMGYAGDPRVERTMEWLVDTASRLGGWSCWGSGRNLDSWEALSAFAEFPRSRWTGPMETAVQNAVEFYLSRELHRQGDRYAPWYRTHYPVHYYYDLLVGLEIATRLGDVADPRLEFARRWLLEKRRPDGRWNLDAVHPDVEGPVAKWFEAHPTQRPYPWALERAGRPSKMITLRALEVVSRLETTATSPLAGRSRRNRRGAAMPVRPAAGDGPRAIGRSPSSPSEARRGRAAWRGGADPRANPRGRP